MSKYTPEHIEELLQKLGQEAYEFKTKSAHSSRWIYWSSGIAACLCLGFGLQFWWQEQKIESAQNEYVDATMVEDLPLDMEKANESVHLEAMDSTNSQP